MNKNVIVSIRIDEKTSERDIDLPIDIPVSILLKLIISQLMGNTASEERKYSLYADPPGRLLDANETLEEAGVWNGAVLTLKRVK